jgi:hypothetical protein
MERPETKKTVTAKAKERFVTRDPSFKKLPIQLLRVLEAYANIPT